MKRAFHLVAAVGLAVLAAGCQRQGVDGAKKVLNVSLENEIKGFDPAYATDEYSRLVISQIYQPLYQFHYLKRPYEVEPLLAERMPEVSKDGLIYTIHLRPNVVFHPDAAFGAQPRPLKASDVVYTLKRLADPHLKSPNWWLLDNHVVGLNKFRETLESQQTSGRYDKYPVAGLSEPDNRTVVIKLTKPYKQLVYALAMSPTAIVAQEVVEKYGPEFLNHPVGTGPFVFKDWIRGQKIVFDRNPSYFDERYPSVGTPEDKSLGRLVSAGKALPFVDQVVVSIFTETQPRWLNFLKGNLDFTWVPKEATDTLLTSDGNLKSEWLAKGISVSKVPNEDVMYFAFNMRDPLVGRNRFLRQAISSAIDREEWIRVFYKFRAAKASGPIPPDLFGYDPNGKDPNGYDLARANNLMEKAQREYQRQGGRGAIPPILYDMLNDPLDRQFGDLLEQQLARIGLRIERRMGTWPQFRQRLTTGQHQFAFQSWIADYPDPENFLQLFYSKNGCPGPNSANFTNSRYDALYEKMQNMGDGPERSGTTKQMTRILYQETPWVFMVHRMKTTAQHQWLRNFKYHAIDLGQFKYLDINLPRQSEK
jgi:oligopeptide transport system substrate-binding protein